MSLEDSQNATTLQSTAHFSFYTCLPISQGLAGGLESQETVLETDPQVCYAKTKSRQPFYPEDRKSVVMERQLDG